MRQTLLRIPLDGPWTIGPFEVPGFGFGIVLAAWCLFGIVWLVRNPAQRAQLKSLLVPIGTWLAIAAAIVFVPWYVERQPRDEVAQANHALEVDPASLDALILRARAHFAMRDYTEAVADL